MARLIDADALSEYFCGWCSCSTFNMARVVGNPKLLAECKKQCFKQKCIDEQPTVDAVPVVHGHWKQEENMRYSCSNCHALKEQYHDLFCGNCGAKMDREDGEMDGK